MPDRPRADDGLMSIDALLVQATLFAALAGALVLMCLTQLAADAGQRARRRWLRAEVTRLIEEHRDLAEGRSVEVVEELEPEPVVPTVMIDEEPEPVRQAA